MKPEASAEKLAEVKSHPMFSTAIETLRQNYLASLVPPVPPAAPAETDVIGTAIFQVLRVHDTGRLEVRRMINQFDRALDTSIEDAEQTIIRIADVHGARAAAAAAVTPLSTSGSGAASATESPAVQEVSFLKPSSAEEDSSSGSYSEGKVGEKRRRSLGKRATEVLTAWFFQNINDPYPSEEDKARLSQECGMTMNQINNWFGNKRMRYKRKVLGPLREQSMQDPASVALSLMCGDRSRARATTAPARRSRSRGAETAAAAAVQTDLFLFSSFLPPGRSAPSGLRIGHCEESARACKVLGKTV